MQPRCVVLAAGGTGGHLFPAVSLAQTLHHRGVKAVFLTDGRGTKYLPENSTYKTIAAASLGGSPVKKILALFKILFGTLQSLWHFIRWRPDVIVGFGGYPSFPAVLAGKLWGARIFLHEQNAVLGRANRVLAPFAEVIPTSFSHTEPDSAGFARKYLWVGNPVRQEIAALADTPYTPPANAGELRILVTGGSQGSRIFSDVLPQAILKLPADFQRRLHITQQCRPEDMEEVSRQYATAQNQVMLKPFFDDMPNQLSRCHMIICRGGASTVAEVTVAGRPALFVPLPGAIDDHQRRNALVIEAAGGAWVVPQDSFSPEWLSEKLETLLAAPKILEKMAEATRRCAQPEAAEKLADLLFSANGLKHISLTDKKAA